MGLRQRIEITDNLPFGHLRMATKSLETEISSKDRERASPQSFIESDHGERGVIVVYMYPSRTACSKRL